MEQPDLEFSPGEGDDGPVEVPFEELDDDGGKDIFPKIVTIVIFVNTISLLGLFIVGLLGPRGSQGEVGGSTDIGNFPGTDIGNFTGFPLPLQGSKAGPACDMSCCCEVCLGLCWLPQLEVDLAPLPPPRPSARRNTTRTYRLICVFEFIRYLSNTRQLCTDYVYIAAAPLYRNDNIGPFIFSGNISDIHIGPLPKSRREELQMQTRRKIGTLRRNFKNARWFVGVWGTRFWEWSDESDPDVVYAVFAGLHHYINGVMQYNGLNTSDFSGFAIINSALRSHGYLFLEIYSLAFEEFQRRLPPEWEMIHTVYMFNAGSDFPSLIQRVWELTSIYGEAAVNAFPDVFPTRWYPFKSQMKTEIISLLPQKDYKKHYSLYWDHIKSNWSTRGDSHLPCYQFTTAIFQFRHTFDPERRPDSLSRIDRERIRDVVQDPQNKYVLENSSLDGGGYVWKNGSHTIFAFNKHTLHSYINTFFNKPLERGCIVLEDVGEDSTSVIFKDNQSGRFVEIEQNIYQRTVFRAMERTYPTIYKP